MNVKLTLCLFLPGILASVFPGTAMAKESGVTDTSADAVGDFDKSHPVVQPSPTLRFSKGHLGKVEMSYALEKAVEVARQKLRDGEYELVIPGLTNLNRTEPNRKDIMILLCQAHKGYADRLFAEGKERMAALEYKAALELAMLMLQIDSLPNSRP
ncbi:MAG: hypothetical protein SFV17_03655 [Candidatus Obscuribacter sp.]|nr:hypothetical protein [Candidatus Obscuribacter sp.]